MAYFYVWVQQKSWDTSRTISAGYRENANGETTARKWFSHLCNPWAKFKDNTTQNLCQQRFSMPTDFDKEQRVFHGQNFERKQHKCQHLCLFAGSSFFCSSPASTVLVPGYCWFSTKRKAAPRAKAGTHSPDKESVVYYELFPSLLRSAEDREDIMEWFGSMIKGGYLGTRLGSYPRSSLFSWSCPFSFPSLPLSMKQSPRNFVGEICLVNSSLLHHRIFVDVE